MAELTQEQLKDRWQRFSRLPSTVQDAFFSPIIAQDMNSIAQKYQLADAQPMAEAIGEVFLGLLHPNLFIRAVSERLVMPPERSRALALDVSARIFSRVRNELLKLYQIPGQAAPTLQPSSPSRPPMPPLRPAQSSSPSPPYSYSRPMPQQPKTVHELLNSPAPLQPAQPTKPLTPPSPTPPSPSQPAKLIQQSPSPKPSSSFPPSQSPPMSPLKPSPPLAPSQQPAAKMTPTQAALSGNTVNLRDNQPLNPNLQA